MSAISVSTFWRLGLVNIPPEKIDWIKKTWVEFDAVQDYLSELMEPFDEA